jgi:hypothetical protein
MTAIGLPEADVGGKKGARRGKRKQEKAGRLEARRSKKEIRNKE